MTVLQLSDEGLSKMTDDDDLWETLAELLSDRSNYTDGYA